MSDFLADAFPKIARQVPKLALADLPTPLTHASLTLPSGRHEIAIKGDDATSTLYGGNKVRKLEYLLRRARDRGARRVATFGAAGSNHALATAIHATDLDLPCTCFLSHQKATPNVARTLNMHRLLGTEIIPWGAAADRLALFRRHLQGRGTWVIPLGGTCWLGCLGFVAAGLELAQQIVDGEVPRPARIYIACGTTGSAAGIALGLAIAGSDAIVHAVQVANNPFASERKMRKLMAKTQFILHRIDRSFVASHADARIVWRDEFLAGGYARVDERTERAVATARSQLALSLETTYTGKAMAAMLEDLQDPGYDGAAYLFWNTYNSRPLPVTSERPASLAGMPRDFERYFPA